MRTASNPTLDIQKAAEWLGAHNKEIPGPVTKELRDRFGLKFGDAIKAMAVAKRKQRGRA